MAKKCMNCGYLHSPEDWEQGYEKIWHVTGYEFCERCKKDMVEDIPIAELSRTFRKKM